VKGMFAADLAPTNCLCRGSAVECRRWRTLTAVEPRLAKNRDPAAMML
jgi:hypothetical protein